VGWRTKKAECPKNTSKLHKIQKYNIEIIHKIFLHNLVNLHILKKFNLHNFQLKNTIKHPKQFYLHNF